jgi:hypothetical protein
MSCKTGFSDGILENSTIVLEWVTDSRQCKRRKKRLACFSFNNVHPRKFFIDKFQERIMKKKNIKNIIIRDKA